MPTLGPMRTSGASSDVPQTALSGGAITDLASGLCRWNVTLNPSF